MRHAASGRPTQQNLAVTSLVFAILGLGTALEGQSYGYRRAEDPLVLGVKSAIKAARDERSVALDQALAALSETITEVQSDLGVDLGAAIRGARSTGQVDRIAYQLTHLVFQALRHKLYWNQRQQLSGAVAARARIDAAQFYYEEILSHAVRRADSDQGAHRHGEILDTLRALRSTLGSPGLFGVGERPADPQRFAELTATIETLLWQVYPDFAGRPKAPESTDSKPGDAQPAGKKPITPAPPSPDTPGPPAGEGLESGGGR